MNKPHRLSVRRLLEPVRPRRAHPGLVAFGVPLLGIAFWIALFAYVFG